MKPDSIWVFLVLAIFSSFSYASDMNFGSGGKTGSYYAMVDDVVSYCGSELGTDRKGNPNRMVNNVETAGSVGSLIGMTNKAYIGGVVQEDVLQFYSKNDPANYNQNRLKIIAGMHKETGHLLIPKDFKPSGGSMWSKAWSVVSNKPPEPLNIESLRGESIGAWGGSIVSAKALSHFLDLEANIVNIKPEQAKSADIPLLIVAGQPSKTVKDLLATGRFILAPINYAQLSARQPFYLKMDANYEIDGEISTVQTFGVRAFLLGKAFRNEARNKPLSLLANCINESVIDMADDPETSPNWASVYEINQLGLMTNWAYFPLVSTKKEE